MCTRNQIYSNAKYAEIYESLIVCRACDKRGQNRYTRQARSKLFGKSEKGKKGNLP
jgi:hypothetical protein